MRKNAKLIVIISILIILGGSYIKKFFDDKYKVTLADKDKYWEIKYKGLGSSKDFAVDLKGNYYIAYKDRIQFISVSGQSYKLLGDDNFSISSLEFINNKLYFASNDSVFSYDLKTRVLEELINNLPNFGDYKDSVMKLNGEDLYISIGAATNSGVVGPDNEWVKTNTYSHDISPFNIIINGLKFGDENTGAFVPYRTKNIQSQIIPGHFPGNASIIKINLKNKKSENFAWGIRNVKGMDFDSKGKLYASVGGMEDRGLRPIQYDYDYLFEIKKNQWYGWPDYSGGDPINSPRFNRIKDDFIIQKQPTVNPPAPIYQNKYLSSLGTLVVDKKNDFGNQDSIFFYDQKPNSISELTKEGNSQKKIGLNSKSYISSIKFYNGSLILLDSKAGVIIQVSRLNIKTASKFSQRFLYGFIIIIFAGIIFMLKSLNNKA